jgi:PKD domain
VMAINDVNNDGTDFDIAPNQPADGRVNIRQVFVAEPYFEAGVNKLVFTIQVSPSSASTPLPSSQWYLIWNRLNPDSDFDRWYVGMKTDATGATSFEYGKFGVPLDPTNPNPNANTPVKLGDVDSGTYDIASGVITITLSTSNAENIHAGQSLTALNARTFMSQPDSGPKSQRNASDVTDDATYALIGNDACNTNPPTAVLSAKPTSGFAPLKVTFDGSKSFDSGGDSIVLYTFDFGDGSSKVSQSAPGITHTYSITGNYFATLTVTDSSGVKSTNQPAVGIQVKKK